MEAPNFSISLSTITTVEETIESNDELFEYVKASMAAMFNEQPILYGYVKRVAKNQPDLFTYSIGVAASFDIISSQLKQDGNKIEINEHDIEVHDQNKFEFFEDPRWKNLAWADEQVDKGERPITDVSWFVDLLRETSPAFLSFIRDTISTFGEDVEKKQSFMLGAFDVAMPFWGKAVGLSNVY